MSAGSSPLVSVVMPVYNHARFVGDAIRSVFAQGHRPVELIVIDDGSADGSADAVRAVLAEGAPSGIAVDFSSRPNRGAHATINEGLDRARGDYLTILNSDDLYAPGRLARCVAAAKERRERLFFTLVQAISAAGDDLPIDHPWRRWYARVYFEGLIRHPSAGMALLFDNVVATSGNLFFDRALHAEVGGFRPYRYAHDLDFALRAARLTEPHLIREYLYSYRLHDANTISGGGTAVGDEVAEILHDHLRVLAAAPPANPAADCFAAWPAVFNGAPLTPPLHQALDRFLRRRDPPRRMAPTPVPRRSGIADVVLLTHELSRSGGPTVAVDVARALRQAGRRPLVLSPKDGELRADLARSGIDVGILRVGNLRRRDTLRKLPARMLVDPAVIGRLPGWRERVLVVNTSAAWKYGARYMRKWRGPVVWYIHETIDPEMAIPDPAALSALAAAVRRGQARLLFGSDATRRPWAHRGLDGTVCYWSGIPAASRPARPPPAAGRRTILTVGSSPIRKGTPLLVEAFMSGAAGGLIPDDVDLCIVGLDPPSDNLVSRELIRRIGRAGFMDRIRLHGIVEPDALPSFYDEATLYVQASIMECLPLSLLQAMANGLPIVTTDADGCAEAIVDGESGIVVPPGDAARLAGAIGKLLADAATAERFGNAAVERFNRLFAEEVTRPVLLRAILGG